jgi:hypothetical protein
VIWIQGWSPNTVGNERRRWDTYFEKEKGWVRHKEIAFIFDEAQLSYGDGDLWNNIFKSIRFHDDRAIAFASYGSLTSRITIDGTLIVIDDMQRVTLRPIQHDDDIPSVGLFFTRTEFDDLVLNCI